MRVQTPAQIAAFVRGRRTELGWSQADLAARAGVSRKWVVDFEAGKSRVETFYVLRALDALGVVMDLVVDTAAEERPGQITLDAIIADHRRG